MVFAYLRRYPELVPLFVCVGAGCVGCAWFIGRTAIYHPDASFDKKNNPYPWNKVKHNEQRRLYTQSDYSKIEKKNPDYAKE
ncbi:cytochrome c oxidase subunit NDUFA4-like [Actinia tenebrosa]|uniref:Cytochrome c oxidase subunit NDUFA4-like n=1 Tax=Actinia tenebrosa TaxID=6105 RepID=A0A6P8I9G1_ACTTE|nr:cytochrome c oxidase subunit NDUFA4-like [Actinia tenebrosa]